MLECGYGVKTMNTVYCADVSFLNDEACFREFLNKVGGNRKAYIEKCKIPEEKARRLGVWLALMFAFAENGLEFDENKIRYSATGKPFYLDNPLYFNLSHSGKYAICAVSDIDVGVDIEKNSADLKYVSKKYPEISSVKDWTKKESCGKLTGKGLTEILRSDFFYQSFDLDDYTLTTCTKEKRDFLLKHIKLK